MDAGQQGLVTVYTLKCCSERITNASPIKIFRMTISKRASFFDWRTPRRSSSTRAHGSWILMNVDWLLRHCRILIANVETLDVRAPGATSTTTSEQQQHFEGLPIRNSNSNWKWNAAPVLSADCVQLRQFTWLIGMRNCGYCSRSL